MILELLELLMVLVENPLLTVEVPLKLVSLAVLPLNKLDRAFDSEAHEKLVLLATPNAVCAVSVVAAVTVPVKVSEEI